MTVTESIIRDISDTHDIGEENVIPSYDDDDDDDNDDDDNDDDDDDGGGGDSTITAVSP